MVVMDYISYNRYAQCYSIFEALFNRLEYAHSLNLSLSIHLEGVWRMVLHGYEWLFMMIQYNHFIHLI